MDIFEDKMKHTGWIQGKKKRAKKGATYWVVDTITNDPTTHIHVGPEFYLKHAHDDMIIDKPRKIRRFSVRCLKLIPNDLTRMLNKHHVTPQHMSASSVQIIVSK